MTTQTVQELPPATGEFVNLILAGIDPSLSGQSQRLQLLTGPFQQQQTRMRQITRNRTLETAKTLRQQMFYLSPGALRTLDLLDLSTETKNQVRALNVMFFDFQQHEVNYRLKTLAAIPPTEPGQPGPDWQSFWTQNLDSYIGIYRPQDHDPLRDPVSETLNTVILAMARQAAAHLPDHRTLASHILSTRKKDQQKLLRLSEVFIATLRIRELAQRLGLRPDQTQHLLLTPEETFHRLQEAGLSPRRDMGTLTSLEELRRVLPGPGLTNITTNTPAKIWHETSVPDSYVLHSHYISGNHPTTSPEEAHQLGPAERSLIQMTVTDYPGISQGFATGRLPAASAIAYVNRTTPEQVLAYLEGRSDDPTPPEPRPCPLATTCPTWCGRSQHLDGFPHPVNFNGRHESCQYHQFLTIHLHSPAQIRETAAALQVRNLQKHMKTLRPAQSQDPAESQALEPTPTISTEKPRTVQPNLL